MVPSLSPIHVGATSRGSLPLAVSELNDSSAEPSIGAACVAAAQRADLIRRQRVAAERTVGIRGQLAAEGRVIDGPLDHFDQLLLRHFFALPVALDVSLHPDG